MCADVGLFMLTDCSVFCKKAEVTTPLDLCILLYEYCRRQNFCDNYVTCVTFQHTDPQLLRWGVQTCRCDVHFLHLPRGCSSRYVSTFIINVQRPINSLFLGVFFWRVCQAAKSDSAPAGRMFVKFDIWEYFSEIRRENSGYIKIWQE